ncbi:MAG: hypothetical protein M3458_05955 [Acidobacteriota bacterium]|nr:hypothetical protein [Acidobacteriota bacterium]
MGGIFCQFTVGRAGAGEGNARYITRVTATGRDEKGVYLHNYPAHIRSNDDDQQRQKIVEFNRQREQDELARKRTGGGTTRTHYRCKVSFEGKVDTKKAHEMVKEYLEKNFPTARAVAAVHQDTAHTHVHLNIQARGIDDRKLHLSEGKFKNLDSAWGRIYGREFGRKKAIEHEREKEEMRRWKREYVQARECGEELKRPAPRRADRRLGTAEHEEREARNHGADQTRIGGDQRAASDQDRGTERGKQPLDQCAEWSERAHRAAHGAVHGVEQLRGEIAQLGERAYGREHEEGGIER